jgi:hypothetical protein
MTRWWLPLLMAAAAAIPRAEAGTTFTLALDNDGGGEAAPRHVVLRVWASGSKVKAQLVSGRQPAMPAGSYLLSDAATSRTMLVDPQAGTWSTFDASSLAQAAPSLMTSMGGKFEVQHKGLQVEDLGEQDGGTVAGYPARRHRIRISYTTEFKMPVMSREAHQVIEEDLWTSRAPGEAIPWLARLAHTGDAEFDKQVEAKCPRISGFLLKRQRTTKASGMGRDTLLTESIVVSDLKTSDVAPGTFDLPAGSREIPATPGTRPPPGRPQP